jgi:putative oxidoreductase
LEANRINKESDMNTNNTATLSLIGRVLLAFLFVFSGIGKIAAPAATMGYISAMGLPLPAVALGGAIAVEVIGGLMLAFGLYTRTTALIMAAFTLVTGLVFHSAIGDQNQLIHLLKNFSIAGGLLQVAAFGAGALSLDARRGVAQGRVAHA